MMESVAVRVFSALDPVSRSDNGDLETYIGALGDVMFQEIDGYVSDGSNGERGWSVLVDLDRIPDKGLPWLAQFIGVSIPPGLTAQQQRDRIASTSGWNRGTLAAMAAAAQPYLTGAKTVTFRERDPVACASQPAYGLTVITKESETPTEDWAATNLQENSGFEPDAVGYTPVSVGAGAGRSSAIPHSGSFSYYVPFDASGGGWIISNKRDATRFPVTAGKLYTLSTYVIPFVGSRVVGMGMDWYDAGGALVGNPRMGGIVPPVGVYTRIEYTQTAPAGAVSCNIYPMIWNAGSAGDWYLIDDVQFEQNSRATPLIPTTTGPASRPFGTGPVGKALLEQKPAGIILNYVVLAGQDYLTLYNAGATTYQTVFTTYATYQGVVNAAPGT